MRTNIKDDTRIRDYVRTKEIRSQVLCSLTGGKFCYFVDGNWISEQEFNELYPPELRPLTKSLENPDKTKVI